MPGTWRGGRIRQLLQTIDTRRGAQARLAKALGVSTPTVSQWISGKKQPGGPMLVNLAAYLGTTADDLLPPTLQPDRPASGL